MPNVTAEPLTDKKVIDKKAKTEQPTRYGVHSEVGKLRKVLVCPPGLAHIRALRRATAMNSCSTTSYG